MKRLLLMFLMAVMLYSLPAAAAEKGTILYIPMDNRPVCLDYSVQTMREAGWDVKVPPREYIASADKNGDPEKMFAWLQENMPESLAVVASSDALLYGGLVGSRTHEIPLEVIKERAQMLLDLKKNYGNKLVYVFTTIMRSPKMSSAPVEPEYYAQWGSQIFRLGALEDKLEAKEITRKEVKELAELRLAIPREILEDMYSRRHNNIKATELLMHGVESGDFDYMLVGRDDTATYSQAHREARDLDILVNELPKERIRFFAGADQLGLLLLSRASTRLQYHLPFVNTVYAPGTAGSTIPSYEDDTVAVSAKHHIYAAGAIPVAANKAAELTLALNTPSNGITLEASNAANNYTVTPETEKFTKRLHRLLDEGRNVAVADIKYGNGADNALVSTLFKNGDAYRLTAYSGWNTAGNSLGFALAQGLLSDMYRSGAKDELLNIRYLDDWAYQSNVRVRVYQELIWPNHWPNSGLNPEQVKVAEERITSDIYEVAEPVMGTVVQRYRFTLPWQRMFEVYVAEK